MSGGATRVVALDWAPAEMLLSLGVAPLGITEADNYRDWVGTPVLPAGTADMGLRSEPNLEAIAALKPQLIVTSEGFPPATEVLDTIAPSVRIGIYGHEQPALLRAGTELSRLAALLDRQEAARQVLVGTEAAFDQAATALEPLRRFSFYVASPSDDRHLMLFGKGSLFGDVLERLQLRNAWTGTVDGWGSATVGLELLRADDAVLLLLGNGAGDMLASIRASATWRHLPAIAAGHAGVLPPCWSFGALSSARRFAGSLAASAGSIA